MRWNADRCSAHRLYGKTKNNFGKVINEMIMKKAIGIFLMTVVCLCQTGTSLTAQTKYFTKSGSVTFSAEGPIKNIRGENKKGSLLLDPSTGNIQLGLLMVAFEFPRTIFKNVDYLESDKYPKSFY